MQEKNCYLPVVGFDNDAVMKEFLSTGKLVATADIFSSQMAVRGIEFALAFSLLSKSPRLTRSMSKRSLLLI